MSKWICKEECYVTIDGKWKLCAPGDPVSGNIKKSSQKFFDLIEPDNKTVEIVELTNNQLKSKLKELGIKHHPNANKATLKQLLADNQPDKADG